MDPEKTALFERVSERLLRQMVRAEGTALTGDPASVAVFSTQIVLEMLREMTPDERATLLADDDLGQPCAT